MIPTKTCPVILRGESDPEVLMFVHPLGGSQLVKGTIEHGEDLWTAALRELQEESGIHCASVVADLGYWASGYFEQVWTFHLCETPSALPDAWSHKTEDGGGHTFNFFWHRLSQDLCTGSHAVYQRALEHLRLVLIR